MSINNINPDRKKASVPLKKNSGAIRLWHWVNALIISGSFLTVLIGSTLTDDDQISQLLKSEFTKIGIHLNQVQSDTVAGALSDNTWTIHVYIGYALAGLILFRVILEFFQPKDQRFIARLSVAYHRGRSIVQNRKKAKKSFYVQSFYGLFYGVLLVIVVTGLSLAFQFTFLKQYEDDIREVHGFCMYLILAFIAIHIIGIFLAERTDSPGSISDMVNGGTLGRNKND